MGENQLLLLSMQKFTCNDALLLSLLLRVNGWWWWWYCSLQQNAKDLDLGDKGQKVGHCVHFFQIASLLLMLVVCIKLLLFWVLYIPPKSSKGCISALIRDLHFPKDSKIFKSIRILQKQQRLRGEICWFSSWERRVSSLNSSGSHETGRFGVSRNDQLSKNTA